jgi:Superinfection immunity protein
MEPLLLLLAVYFIPALVASTRRHRQQLAIVVLNVLAGWTLIGWVVAFVWACTADVQPKQPKQPVAPLPLKRVAIFVGGLLLLGLLWAGMSGPTRSPITVYHATGGTTVYRQ